MCKNVLKYSCLRTQRLIYINKEAFLHKNNKKSIAEIAAELNFSNRSHFYKLFRERYSMSPMQYKKGGPK